MARELPLVAVGIITSYLVCGWAQAQESLRARAKTEGGTVAIKMYADYSEYSVPQLVKRADAIVHGRVVDVRTHLRFH
jgi:hypothetical protein